MPKWRNGSRKAKQRYPGTYPHRQADRSGQRIPLDAILGVCCSSSWRREPLINGMFGLLIIASVIGMVQEIRAKQTLDKLAIIGQAETVGAGGGTRTRSTNGWCWTTSSSGPGDQVVRRRRRCVEEENLEIDELLTGRPTRLPKTLATVMSGGSSSGAGAAPVAASICVNWPAEASKFTW